MPAAQPSSVPPTDFAQTFVFNGALPQPQRMQFANQNLGIRGVTIFNSSGTVAISLYIGRTADGSTPDVVVQPSQFIALPLANVQYIGLSFSGVPTGSAYIHITTDIVVAVSTTITLNTVALNAPDGYAYLPGGTLLQWGEQPNCPIDPAGGPSNIIFPIPFPNQVFQIVVSPHTFSPPSLGWVDILGITLPQFRVFTWGNGPVGAVATVRYIATGI
jgi:hypothetical protein